MKTLATAVVILMLLAGGTLLAYARWSSGLDEADAALAAGNYEQAIAAYNLVIQNYPKGDWVPWAYYKRGMAQIRLQQTAAARASFEALVKLYPDTEPGIQALSRLQSLDSAPPPPRKP